MNTIKRIGDKKEDVVLQSHKDDIAIRIEKRNAYKGINAPIKPKTNWLERFCINLAHRINKWCMRKFDKQIF